MYNILIFFAEKISIFEYHLNVNFNESLTNDIISFEQLGHEILTNPVYCLLMHLETGRVSDTEDPDQKQHFAILHY